MPFIFSYLIFRKNMDNEAARIEQFKAAIWGEADTEFCAKLVRENKKSFTALLNNLASLDMDQLLSYTNSKGTKFKSARREILTHVALHGRYHRGQINSWLRATGMKPVNIDFITFRR